MGKDVLDLVGTIQEVVKEQGKELNLIGALEEAVKEQGKELKKIKKKVKELEEELMRERLM